MVSSSHKPIPPFQPGCVKDVSAECERGGVGEEVRRRRGSRASRLRWSKAAIGPKVTRSGMARRRYIGLRMLEILAMWRAWSEGKRGSWMASVIGACSVSLFWSHSVEAASSTPTIPPGHLMLPLTMSIPRCWAASTVKADGSPRACWTLVLQKLIEIPFLPASSTNLSKAWNAASGGPVKVKSSIMAEAERSRPATLVR